MQIRRDATFAYVRMMRWGQARTREDLSVDHLVLEITMEMATRISTASPVEYEGDGLWGFDPDVVRQSAKG